MQLNGLDLSGLEIEMPLELPETVPGRVLQVDADQLCYLAGCHDDEPFATAKHNFHSVLETFMIQAGAEYYTLHLTGADKGGRFEIATVKEYQANRKGKAKPKHLMALREYVGGLPEAVYHNNQEADDGMAQGNYAAIKAGNESLSVICSADKDLRMCSGYHLNQQTGELVHVDGYGEIRLTEGKSKAVKGYGTSFFWAQLLMGDTADNIPGLPALGPDTLVRYPEFHTKALLKLLDRCECGDTKAEDTAAQKIMSMKHKLCGAVAAYNVLKDVTGDKEAFATVLQCYRDHYGTDPFEYTTWAGETVTGTATSMLIEQMHLLWMRRVHGTDDVLNFLKGIQDDGTWKD